VPDIAIGNAEVAERIGKTPDWIRSRTGIEERRVLAPGQRLADLAAAAARAALDDAGASAGDIDIVLLATASADDVIPNLAPEVAGLIGAGHAAGIDVGAACTGFLTGLGGGGARRGGGGAAPRCWRPTAPRPSW
jgi:3-oxoacyl-[acyl-carrier-protein] synthase-3